MADKFRMSLIGPGMVGLTLTRFLQNKGYPIIAVVGRTPESATRVEQFLSHVNFSTEIKDSLPDSDMVLVCVSENAIGKVCEELSLLPVRGKTIFHTSGIKSFHELDPLHNQGAEIGSIHPLQSFIHVEESIKSLPGTYYAVEGTADALEIAATIIRDLEGFTISVNPEMKALYHAGACISANYLVSMIRLAETFFKKSGVEPDKIIPSIMGLVDGVLKNIQSRGTLESITGPIARGDHETLKLQLETIRKYFPQHLPIFRALSMLCANTVFERSHANPDQIDEIMWLLERNLMDDIISTENEEKAPHGNRKIE